MYCKSKCCNFIKLSFLINLFRYNEPKPKMHSSYKLYNKAVPEYLLNRPYDFNKNCLEKIALAIHSEVSGVWLQSHGAFTVNSFSGIRESYTVDFGSDKMMPKCSCKIWRESAYLCKHFFLIFKRFPETWSWNSLSLLYRNPPFLTLDNDDENTLYIIPTS